MKPIMYNCEKCSEVLVLKPTRTQDNGGQEIYTMPAYCPECLKTEPMLEFFIKVAPFEYNISEALDENVRLGNMTRRWNSKRNDWEYKMTARGRDEVQRMFKDADNGNYQNNKEGTR